MQISKIQSSAKVSRGYLIALGATVLLSFTSILISYLNRTYALPALVLSFWRALFVSIGMLAALRIIRPSLFRLDRLHWPFMLLYGLTLACFNSIWTYSVQFNGAAVATVLAYISPAIIAILSRWLLNEKITLVKAISIILSLTGTVLVSGAYAASAWKINSGGIVFGLLTGLFFAIYSLLGKKASERSINSWTTLLYSFCGATFFLLLFNLMTSLFTEESPLSSLLWLGDSVRGWTILFLLAIGPTIGGFGLYMMSLGYLPATVVNLIATLEPALTAVWAYLLFSEQLTGLQLFGGFLILTGVILLRIGER
jgi:drug/metabolite transporter (DMT)-like permease